MHIWIAFREDGAVYQERTVIGLYTTEAAAQAAADDELREAIEEGRVPYIDPDTEEEEIDWEVHTLIEGPFTVEVSAIQSLLADTK